MLRGSAALWRRAVVTCGATAAASAAAAARSEPSADSGPRTLGVVVLFRHGARSPVFSPPVSVGARRRIWPCLISCRRSLTRRPSIESPLSVQDNVDNPAYETVHACPQHAAQVRMHGGKAYARYAPTGSPGNLTHLGWAQGEALGRRLRSHYGGGAELMACHSTDTQRTVLTACAVITGFEPGTETPVDLHISCPALGIDTTCLRLSALLSAGRAAHREADRSSREVRATLRRQFEEAANPAACGPLCAYDDCIARRAYGHPPSYALDPALCDCLQREAARELRAALRHGGDETLRLVGGRLCSLLVDHFDGVLAAAEAAGADGGAATPACIPVPVTAEPSRPAPALAAATAPRPAARDAPKIVLLSGHDISLLSLANVLDQLPSHAACDTHPTARPAKVDGASPYNHIEIDLGGVLRGDGVWPPHASCMALELLSNGTVRILYQFEQVGVLPLAVLRRELRRLAIDDTGFARLCAATADGDVAAFQWGA